VARAVIFYVTDILYVDSASLAERGEANPELLGLASPRASPLTRIASASPQHVRQIARLDSTCGLAESTRLVLISDEGS
jgi:hypothetical protein